MLVRDETEASKRIESVSRSVVHARSLGNARVSGELKLRTQARARASSRMPAQSPGTTTVRVARAHARIHLRDRRMYAPARVHACVRACYTQARHVARLRVPPRGCAARCTRPLAYLRWPWLNVAYLPAKYAPTSCAQALRARACERTRFCRHEPRRVLRQETYPGVSRGQRT